MGIKTVDGTLQELVVSRGTLLFDLFDVLLCGLLLEEVTDASSVLDNIVDTQLEVTQAEGLGDVIVSTQQQ